MATVLGVGFKDAVGGGVVASCVHGIGAGFVKGCLARSSVSDEEASIAESGMQCKLTGKRTSLEETPVMVTMIAVDI